MTYKCHTCNADNEYNIKTVSVPQAAIGSASGIIRFYSSDPAIAPAIKRKSIVGQERT